MAVQFAVTALGALPMGFAFEGLATSWTPRLVLSLVWLAGVLSFGSYALLWFLVARTNATRASSLFYFTPPTTMLMAWLLFDDRLMATDLVGLALAAVGVSLVRLPDLGRSGYRGKKNGHAIYTEPVQSSPPRTCRS